ncbi:hypothetical protein E2C01_015101 [Portunus trituberculatus]|uniref:Uncharacterized protein n=1 Tax=Portunus trituberculatus TaxID=210409 RepID=A0A5B7DM91_PORTR|nr:hypothetical protein [Portunus trituberculatus]
MYRALKAGGVSGGLQGVVSASPGAMQFIVIAVPIIIIIIIIVIIVILIIVIFIIFIIIIFDY